MTLNEAIKTVLLTKLKKDAKEAHKIVESAGYEICKISGGWEIRNKKNNGKWIMYYNNGYLSTMLGYRHININKFDYVNYLEKPYNKVYYDTLYLRSKMKKGNYDFDSKFEQLSRMKCWITNGEKEIASLEKKLKSAYETQARRIAECNALRKQFGLKERW